MKRNTSLIVLSLAALLSFVATPLLAEGEKKAEATTEASKEVKADPKAAEAITAAKEAQKKASAAKYEWRDTGKMIKKAEEAAAKGDTKKAIKLANKATKQAENAIKQAESQKSAGPNLERMK